MRPLLLVVAAGLLLLVPAAPAAAFDLGVAAGEVGATTAKIWTRAPRAGKVRYAYSGAGRARTGTAAARNSRDRTVHVVLTGLRPDTAYTYRFTQGTRRSVRGRFRTAPRASARKTVRFAFSGDADAQPARPGGRPAYNDFEVYGRMARERNAFNVNLGDTIYSDSEVGATIVNGRFQSPAPALTVAQKWAKYRQNIALANLRRLRAAAGLYSHWDDHEFINDFSPEEYSGSVFRAGVRAFTDYAPVRHSASRGLYRRFRWGRNVELFFLDQRSFRSAKASFGGTCDNPETKAPDLAPTAPQPVRDRFALIAPSLGQPVSPACLAKINDPSRTMLGASQIARFFNDVRRSTATFKVIMNEVPMHQLYALPYDRWEGYNAERTRVLNALGEVPGAVVLTTDMHANITGPVRLQTLEAGGIKEAGFPEVIAGPVATLTFSKEIDEALGRDGSGKLVEDLFFKPAPPDGLGFTCASTDTFAYGQVEATRSRLTVRIKDATGKAVCPPLRVDAP